MLRDRLHVSWGRREWEIQGITDGGYLQFTGPPFLTRADAIRVLPVWRGYDWLSAVCAKNVRTGEAIR